jgi:hypothetical protein
MFLREPGWENREWSLAELNQELAWYLKERANRRRHRRLNLSKEEAWLTVNQRGGTADIPLEAWAAAARPHRRTLDGAGCFDFEGSPYQVKELHSCRVSVYQGILDGRVWVEDLEGRRKYAAQPFVPQPAGEYRAAPKTPLEVLLSEPLEGPAERFSFQPAQSNVLHLVRSKGAPAGTPAPPGEGEKEIFPGPPLAKGGESTSLEELAAGLEVMEGPAPGDPEPEEEIFASEVEWYAAMRVRQLKGLVLDPETLARMRQIEESSRAYALLKDDIERRARLTVVG